MGDLGRRIPTAKEPFTERPPLGRRDRREENATAPASHQIHAVSVVIGVRVDTQIHKFRASGRQRKTSVYGQESFHLFLVRHHTQCRIQFGTGGGIVVASQIREVHKIL